MSNYDSFGCCGSTWEGHVHQDFDEAISNGLLDDISSKGNIRTSLMRGKLDMATEKSIPGK